MTKNKTDFGNPTAFNFGGGEPKTECRYIVPKKSEERGAKHRKYANAETFAKEIVIDKGSRVFAILNGTFVFGDFIEALIRVKGYNVKKMTISTLSLSELNIDSLERLLKEGLVNELNLLVSEYFWAHEKSATVNNVTPLIPLLLKKLDIDNIFQLAVCATHCKMCIFEVSEKKYNYTPAKFITIHGSANLRSSANLEQIEIEESEELYKFNEDVQDKILKEYHIIQKPVRFSPYNWLKIQ